MKVENLDRLNGLEGTELKFIKWQPVAVVIYGSHCRLKSLENNIPIVNSHHEFMCIHQQSTAIVSL